MATTARRTKSSVRQNRGRTPIDRAEAIARNIWWTWNPDAKRLLESLDPALFRAYNQNPISTIAELSAPRREVVNNDPAFASDLSKVETQLANYIKAGSWWSRTATAQQKKMLVAYFCMEFALHESIPLYAGGLGILAGDHIKSASDLGIPFIGMGILWRNGYYRQEILPSGDVRILYPPTDFNRIPVTDTGKRFAIKIGNSNVVVAIWRITVGRCDLYLLDTDLPENSAENRKLTHHLYGGGSPEYRVRQEILLGIGGLMALDVLGIKPTVYHLNEGHAAFAPLERVRRLVEDGYSFDEACEEIRAHSVFTTHTPVPEGNDRFDPKLVLKFLGNMPSDLGVSKDEFLALGREDPSNKQEPFCMTVLALKLADHCNGVAELHGDTSRKMWMRTYNASTPEMVPIGHVTNGIHVETWLSDDARPFYDKHFKPKWNGSGPEDDWWKKADKAPAAELWNLRQLLRKRMIAELRMRLREQMIYTHADADHLHALYDTLDENALTIGFARRFALYKRHPLIFKDAKRLAKIMEDADRPVQLIFAGKAHPLDKAGHEYTKTIVEFCSKPPFRGRVFILQNYDMRIGQLLTSGCDVWLNNPVRPLEASGTSGMKPSLHGGLNCSILDGWWPEAYNGRNGWQLGNAKAFKDRAQQDKYDANAIYDTLQKQIVPLFYDRNSKGVPEGWCSMMADGMKTICNYFSTHRMVGQYTMEYYLPAHG